MMSAGSGQTDMNQRERILFYRQDEVPYGKFSNFAKGYPIVIADRVWPTVEHYFQAMHFPDHPEIQEEIRLVDWAGLTKRIFHRHAHRVDEPRWHARRDDVMLDALRAKFGQHPELRDLLLSTGAAELVEHTTIDTYWADGGDGSGKNMLGVLFMRVRDELRGEA